MIRMFGAAVAVMLMALPAMAQEYRCKMGGLDVAGGGGWISKEVVFYIDKAAGEITVNDAIIQYFVKKQLMAKVSEISDARSVFKWSVDTTNQSGQRSRIAYRANFSAVTKKLRVTAIPAGYGNTFFGGGDCVQQ